MLMAACNGGFEEAKSGRVKFPEDDPDTIVRAIFYLYTGEYHACKVPRLTQYDPAEDAPSQSSNNEVALSIEILKTHVLLYQCADKLGVEKLKVRAARYFLEQVDEVVKEDDFAELLRLVFDCTCPDDKMLRLPVARICVHRHRQISYAAVVIMEQFEPLVWAIAVPGAEVVEERRRGSLRNAVEKVNNVMRRIKNPCNHGLNAFVCRDDGVYWQCNMGCLHKA